MQDRTPQPETDEQLAWLQEVIIAHTPTWAHMLAMIAQFRGMRWMRIFPLPIVRYFTDLTVKTETNMQPAGKGFRVGTVREYITMRVFKRGRMIAQKQFTTPRLIKSPYAKMV